MSQVVELTEAEKEKMAYWLSARARGGGWMFVGLTALALAALIWFIAKPQSTPTTEELIPLVVLILLTGGIGWWLLRRRQVIRCWLDEPLIMGNGRILAQQQVPYIGYRIRLQIETERGEMQANLAYLGRPDWQVGDDVELMFWENGRFCPRHFNHIMDFGHLPTPACQRMIRNRIILAVLTYAILVLLAFLFGLYGQGRL